MSPTDLDLTGRVSRAAELHGAGDFSKAEILLGEVLEAQPDHVEALMRRGAALLRLNRAKEALSCYEKVLTYRPRDWRPVHDRGVALLALGRRLDAIAAFDQAIAAQADFFSAHQNRAMALTQLGRQAEAVESFDRALALQPDNVHVLNNRAAALNGLGRHTAALESLDRALALQPDFVAALTNRSNVLRQLNRLEEALACSEKALALQPRHLTAMNERGVALGKLGRLDEALAAFDTAITLSPDFVEAHENRFVILTELGRPKEAAESIDRALRIAPRRVRTFYNLTETRRIEPDNRHLKSMEALARDLNALTQDDQIQLCYALGKSYADIGDYDPSFGWFSKGAALKRRGVAYNEPAALKMLERAAMAFNPELVKRNRGAGVPSRTPVFILGMPRSGTTLVEQLLASHPDVFAAGEIEAFLTAMLKSAADEGIADTPEAFADLSGAALRRLGQGYLNRMSGLAPTAKRIADKSLQSFRFAGLIHWALPNAKLIHVRRNPVDTCVSCFTKLFVDDIPYTYDLTELGRYYRGYETLMDHWRDVLPDGVMLEVRYEDVVADLESQTRRLLDHCGLDWNPACLDFHLTRRPVRTASVTQVRQPIYSSSVGRWRAYSRHLGPLNEALAGA